MAGNVIASVLQIGDSGTATQNFVLKVPAAPDGTLLLQRGNYGAESATILVVSAIGTWVTTASAAAAAGINLPHGTAPTSPVNGDMWTTTSGLFVRINGTTKTVTLT